MTQLTRRDLILALVAFPIALPAHAAAVPYVLLQNETRIEFSFVLAGVAQTGSMPILSADVLVDTQRLQNSEVTVLLDVTEARTKLPFARGPMLGPGVLDSDHSPTIRFVSTEIRLGPDGRISDGATVTGDLTVRGVTQPITLQVDLFRLPGTAKEDLDRLSIHLSGALNRHAFGASGYADLVDDMVGLNIRAEIVRKT